MLEEIAQFNKIPIKEWWEGVIVNGKVKYVLKSNKENIMDSTHRWKYIPLDTYVKWGIYQGYKREDKEGRYTYIEHFGYEAYPKPWSRVEVIPQPFNAQITDYKPGKLEHWYYPPYGVTEQEITTKKNDPVNHPKHYTEHLSGIECIQITEHMGFNLGNALKYIWRCDLKKDAIEDLKKAIWYIQREIDKRGKQ